MKIQGKQIYAYSKACAIFPLSLLILFVASQHLHAFHTVPQSSKLKAPSLSIFKASRMWDAPQKMLQGSETISVEQLKKLKGLFKSMDEIAKKTQEAMSRTAFGEAAGDRPPLRDSTHAVVPYAFDGIKHLYEKKKWTEEEMKLGQEVSFYLAELAEKPELRIEKLSSTYFRKGLVKLAEWFRSKCKNNKDLACMIFTNDFGPFFGGETKEIDLSNAQETQSIGISKKVGKLVLLKTGLKRSPMILKYVKAKGKEVWSKRLISSSDGVEFAQFVKEKPVQELEGFGYKINLLFDWSYGREYAHLYLDNKCNLRFYFIGW